jgi:hypothetical protein
VGREVVTSGRPLGSICGHCRAARWRVGCGLHALCSCHKQAVLHTSNKCSHCLVGTHTYNYPIIRVVPVGKCCSNGICAHTLLCQRLYEARRSCAYTLACPALPCATNRGNPLCWSPSTLASSPFRINQPPLGHLWTHLSLLEAPLVPRMCCIPSLCSSMHRCRADLQLQVTQHHAIAAAAATAAATAATAARWCEQQGGV